MRMIKTWGRAVVQSLGLLGLLGFLTLGAASFARAAADTDRSGEGDWPFFCSLEGFGAFDAFHLQKDDDAESGYVIYLYRDGQQLLGLEAQVWDSDDHAYLNVWGAANIGPFRDRRVYAQIAKDETRQSMSSYDTVFRGTNPDFEMHQSTCQH